jgi:hypothetical protein
MTKPSVEIVNDPSASQKRRLSMAGVLSSKVVEQLDIAGHDVNEATEK